MTQRAKEYGEGLYELAQEENLVAELHEQLMTLADAFRENPDFIRLLDSRGIPLEERLSAAEGLRGEIHPYLVNFLKLLSERGIAALFGQCVEAYHAHYNIDFRTTEAYVTSAVELSEENLEAIRVKMEQISGKSVKLVVQIDPSLLGGLCVEMDGRRYDNSLRSRLNGLRRELAGTL